MGKKCSQCEFYLRCKFKKPTVEEIKKYAVEIGWPEFDAAYYYDKQEITGWVVKIGNSFKPMVCWKASVRTWLKAAFRRGEIKGKGKTFKERFEENKNER